MSVFEELFPASFRNQPFLVNAETKSGGKKTVTHEFVGSDKRFTEELGLIPPSFTIEAIVHGEEAIDRRILLEKALDKPGLGTLEHPLYGTIQVKSTQYSVSSSQTNVGEFRFSINFEVSEAVIIPALVLNTIPQVSFNAGLTRDAIDDAFENSINGSDVPGYSSETLNETSEKTITQEIPPELSETVGDDSIYDTTLGAATKAVGAVRSKVAKANRFVANARSSMLTLVQQPFEIKNNIKSFYASILDIVNSPSDLSDTWNRLIDFGFFDPPIKADTVARGNTANNISILNEHTRLTALANLYESLADKDYTTEDEIDSARKSLGNGYNRIMEKYHLDIDTDTVDALAMDADVRANMANLRVITDKVLNEKAQNVWRVVEINPGISSMPLTTYRFYGDLDNLDELQALNPGINHAHSTKSIQAVS